MTAQHSVRSRLGDIYSCWLGLCGGLTVGATTGASWSCGSESLGIACLHHACLRSQISAFTAALPRLIAVLTRNYYFTLFDLRLHRSVPPYFYIPKLLSRAISYFDAVLLVITALHSVRPLCSQQPCSTKFCTRARVPGPHRI